MENPAPAGSSGSFLQRHPGMRVEVVADDGFVDINKFSLHAMFRNRLLRAYVGASNSHSDINHFTGFADLPALMASWQRRVPPE